VIEVAFNRSAWQPLAEVDPRFDGEVPQRTRRAGARKGSLSPELRGALRAESKRIAALPEAVDVVKAVGDFFAAADAELERVAQVRLAAIRRLRADGWSYQRIADATGLSQARAAQLSRESAERH
jgi:uncharacterized protein YerC